MPKVRSRDARPRSKRHIITVSAEDVRAIRLTLGLSIPKISDALGISTALWEDIEHLGAHEFYRLALIGMILTKRPRDLSFVDYAHCIYRLGHPQLELNPARPSPELVAS